jgi:hypothetical protein
MLATIVAPEILVGKSAGDLGAVTGCFDTIKKLAEKDEVPWSKTHSLFANMGGFVIRCYVPERVGPLKQTDIAPASSDQAISAETTSNHQESDIPDSILRPGANSPQIQSSSTEKEPPDIETQPISPSSEYSNPYHLLLSDIIALREAGFLERLPFISKAELNDKNKSDNLVRAIAMVQILWMVIQIIVRASRHLAISQLELAVVAFAVCAILIYGLNWEKPKGVQTPHTVLQYREDIPKEVLAVLGKERTDMELSTFHNIFRILLMVVKWNNPRDIQFPGSPIPNSLISDSHVWGGTFEALGLFIGGTLFGVIHVAAWKFVFPSLAETRLWRSASIISATVPLFVALIAYGMEFLDRDEISDTLDFIIFRSSGPVILVISIVLYISARLFLIIEILRTLCFFLPSAYIATWAANVPHIA